MSKGTTAVGRIMSHKAQRESELRPLGKVGHAEDLVNRR